MSGGLPVRPLPVGEARSAAALHAAVMDDQWPETAWTAFIADPSVIALCVGDPACPVAVSLTRVVADEAEVLTVAVAAPSRRCGHGLALLAAGLDEAARRGAVTAFLEVAVDNASALALYRKAGFVEIGRRSGYYLRPSGKSKSGAVDAVCMCRTVQTG